jgi:hypothetical protein
MNYDAVVAIDGMTSAADRMDALFERMSSLCERLGRENAMLRAQASTSSNILSTVERGSLCDALVYLANQDDVSDDIVQAMEKAVSAFGGRP